MKLTINEVARSLDLPLSTVERWVRQGRIPMVRSGHTYSFDRPTLEKWAKAHNLVFSDQDLAPEPDAGPAEPAGEETLLAAMRAGSVLYGIRGGTVEAVLGEAVDAMTDFSPEERSELLERLLDRERLTSTGVGKGIAIPHPRTPFVTESRRSAVFTCFLDAPIPYRAVDNRPVFVLFVLLSPTSREHLQILSRLSFCVRDDAFVAFLRNTPEPRDLLSRIEAFERTLDQKGMV